MTLPRLELPRSFFDRLDDELTRSVRVINSHMRKSFDTTKITKDELQRELDAADRQYGQHTTSWQGQTLIVDWPDQQTQVKITVSPIDRIKGKLQQASGVAHRVATKIETNVDNLIAREGQLNTKTDQAFAPHIAILDQANSELDAVESALSVMSNGGPALDPLPSSPTPAQGS